VLDSVHSGQFHFQWNSQNAQAFQNAENGVTPNNCPANNDDRAQQTAPKSLQSSHEIKAINSR
jgi:hypothetical protein